MSKDIDETDDMGEILERLARKQEGDYYRWQSRPGFNFSRKLDPKATGEFLEKLAGDNGGWFNTQMVAAEGDKPESPIYEGFEHDMEEAAMQWRLNEARNLTGSLLIVKDLRTHLPREAETFHIYEQLSEGVQGTGVGDDDDLKAVAVRAFPHGSVNGLPAYMPQYVAQRMPDARRRYVDGLLREIESLRGRLKRFKIFGELVEAMDEITARIEVQAALLEDAEVE